MRSILLVGSVVLFSSVISLSSNLLKVGNRLIEILTFLKGDDELCLKAWGFVHSLEFDGVSLDLVERGVVMSDKVLSSLDGERACLSERVQLDFLEVLKELFSQEHVECEVSIAAHVEDVRVSVELFGLFGVTGFIIFVHL
jgi:hypothetical protein